MIVADAKVSLVLTGTGDVLEPEAGVAGIGSGGNYAFAAARALIDGPLDAEGIVKKSLDIAADICVYTNRNVTIEFAKGRLIMAAYQFRPMSDADLPLIKLWLAAPHVSQWWGNPDEQLTLVSEDLAQPAMDQFIVLQDARPFAYLQCYDPVAWPENGLGPQPLGARGIDQFIGEPDMVGRGHGSAFIRTFIDGLLAGGAPRVLTDPDPDNVRAIRAYEKAGLRKERIVDTPNGRSLLMVRDT